MRFTKESVIAAPPDRVFAFHLLPDALERLIPPWEHVTVTQKADISVVGSRAIIEIKVFGPITQRWVAEHTVYDPPRLFEDIQVSGPFKSWRHRHIFELHRDGTLLRDEIEFVPPFGPLGEMVAGAMIVSKLKKMFDHRHKVTRQWCKQPGA
jgi:ligand-binding SRPBCC domain-containing protein